MEHEFTDQEKQECKNCGASPIFYENGDKLFIKFMNNPKTSDDTAILKIVTSCENEIIKGILSE